MSRQKIKIICALEANNLLQEPVIRRFSVHPYFTVRESSNRFLNFLKDIRKYEKKIFGYYRMSIKSFDELLKIVYPHIVKQQTHFRNPISPEERLTITIR